MRIEDRSRPAAARPARLAHLGRHDSPARFRDEPCKDFAALLRKDSPPLTELPASGVKHELPGTQSPPSVEALVQRVGSVDDEVLRNQDDAPAEELTFRVAPGWAPLEAPAPAEVRAAAPLPSHDAITQPLVQAIAVAVDAHQRKLVFLRVSVPGRGGVDVRLRRGLSGIEVTLSTEDDDLRRDLASRRGELAARGRASNLGLCRIDIAPRGFGQSS